jgi:hypothetical protein
VALRIGESSGVSTDAENVEGGSKSVERALQCLRIAPGVECLEHQPKAKLCFSGWHAAGLKLRPAQGCMIGVDRRVEIGSSIFSHTKGRQSVAKGVEPMTATGCGTKDNLTRPPYRHLSRCHHHGLWRQSDHRRRPQSRQ